MRPRAAVDASALPRVTADHHNPNWWGMLGMIGIQATILAAFVVSYYYLRMSAADWPPGGLTPPPLALETLNLALLLGAAGAVAWARRGIGRGNGRVLSTGLALATALGAIVMLIRWLHLRALPFRWDKHAYGSIVWTISGYHFVLVASALLLTSTILILALRGFWNEERSLAVVAAALFWYLVAFAWIAFYLTIYWTERVL